MTQTIRKCKGSPLRTHRVPSGGRRRFAHQFPQFLVHLLELVEDGLHGLVGIHDLLRATVLGHGGHGAQEVLAGAAAGVEARCTAGLLQGRAGEGRGRARGLAVEGAAVGAVGGLVVAVGGGLGGLAVAGLAGLELVPQRLHGRQELLDLRRAVLAALAAHARVPVLDVHLEEGKGDRVRKPRVVSSSRHGAPSSRMFQELTHTECKQRPSLR